MDRELQSRKFTGECTAAYVATIRGFILEHVAHRLATVREGHGMFGALECASEWDEATDLSLGASGECRIVYEPYLSGADLSSYRGQQSNS